MAYIPATGSVVAFQSQPSSLLVGASIFGQLPGGVAVIGSIATLQGTNPWVVAFNNSSILATQQGTVISSLVSTVPSSVIVGASIFGQLPTGTAVLGSVATLQGTNPWITNIGASVAAVIIGGSVATATTNSSVMLLNGANVIGSVAALQGTAIWNISSVYGNIAGSVVAFQGGTQVTSLVSTVPSSILVGASIFGQLPAGTAVLGSVTVLQGTNPWNISSVYGNISGSVVATQGTNPWVVASLIGTYAEDAAAADGDKGLFFLAVRNDAVASFVSANLDYTPQAVDSAGRSVIKPFSSEDGTIISYTGSVVSTSVTLIQASAIGKRSYITDFWVANTGAATTLITFQGGDTSIVGYTLAPAGGGSNSPGIALPLKTTLSQDLAFKATTGTSILYMTVKGYQAP